MSQHTLAPAPSPYIQSYYDLEEKTRNRNGFHSDNAYKTVGKINKVYVKLKSAE